MTVQDQPTAKPEDKTPAIDASVAKMALKGTLYTALFGLVGTVIATVGLVAVGVMEYRGPGADAAVAAGTSSTPALIVSPVHGEEVTFFTAVRGVAPDQDGVAHWLVIHGVYQGSPYFLSQRVMPNGERSGQWNLSPVQIGEANEGGCSFQLLLVRTEGDVTNFFDSRLRSGNIDLGHVLTPGAKEVDRVEVRRSVMSPTPSPGSSGSPATNPSPTQSPCVPRS